MEKVLEYENEVCCDEVSLQGLHLVKRSTYLSFNCGAIYYYTMIYSLP